MNKPNLIVPSAALEYLKGLPTASVHCVITSPPYLGLRDYGAVGQLGLEATPDAYVQNLVAIFHEVRRVLRRDGVCWVNLGDTYCTKGKRGGSSGGKNYTSEGGGYPRSMEREWGHPAKDLMLIPHRFAIAMQTDGWILRSNPPWIKTNSMPESVGDRPTQGHEYWFMFVKSGKYFYDADAVRQPHSEASKLRETRARTTDRKSISTNPYPDGMKKQTITATTRTGFDPAELDDRIATGQTDLHPLGRNRRTTDPFWESLDAYIAHLTHVRDNGGLLLDVTGYPAVLIFPTAASKEAHFATFNIKMITPLIESSCPKAVCAKCGKPYQRIMEKAASVIKRSERREQITALNNRQQSGTKIAPPQGRTVGFEPTCKCKAGKKAGVVLDPFMGSGTTALAAYDLGREALGCDVNPEYATMANRKLGEWWQTHAVEALPLFAVSTPELLLLAAGGAA